MKLYAYRRTPRGPEQWDEEDHEANCIAEYDPVTTRFQLLDRHFTALKPPQLWNRRPNDAAEFYRWAQEWKHWWSLDPRDAFWFDPDLDVDEGL